MFESQNGDRLSPAQEAAFDWLIQAVDVGSIFHFRSRTGRGRTTVLNKLRDLFPDVKMLGIRDFVEASSHRHPLALEDALFNVIFRALQEHDTVLVDDFHVATAAMGGNCHFYPRAGYLDSPMTVLASYAVEAGKKLIVGTAGELPDALRERSFDCRIGNFGVDDYEHLCQYFTGDKASEVDFQKVHRFAPKLNAHQLKHVCLWCRQTNALNTDDIIEYLRSQHLASNVSLGEVANVDLNELKGVDEVIRSLEANIAVPLEHDELADQLNLKPKRGVLLVGPPGTGKTTVGRALAHRLKGKFFLVDGTFISGTRDFYQMIHRVFEAAKDNAPSVIFIDDSDVIFESGQEHGLYRYLLTMLDGLESESAGRVCVMMTAMDVGNLPPALIRSGRIELWLEMRLPDKAAREAILTQHLNRAPDPLNKAVVADIVEATESFTGADLKRTVEDGKALYAFDRVHGEVKSDVTTYYRAAADLVKESKEKYAEAAARANAAHPSRPAWFNPYSSDYYEPDDDE